MISQLNGMSENYKVHLVPIFEDNYVFVLEHLAHSECVVIDPGSASEVDHFLKKNNLILKAILVTHWHADHTGGANELAHIYQCPIYTSQKTQTIKNFNQFVLAEKGSLLNTSFVALSLAGHTLDHIGFYFSELNILFSGDVVFGLGCGRIFEGTFEQAFASLQKIKNLPDDTLIYCTHEYTKKNLEFTLIHVPNCLNLKKYNENLLNKLKHKNSSIPLTLSEERENNLFLKSQTVAEFKKWRDLRNLF